MIAPFLTISFLRPKAPLPASLFKKGDSVSHKDPSLDAKLGKGIVHEVRGSLVRVCWWVEMEEPTEFIPAEMIVKR